MATGAAVVVAATRKMILVWVLCACVGVVPTPVVVGERLKDTWYTKYPSYPSYCSTPEEMQTRAIPILQENAPFGETRLLHVTAAIRHGARTPYTSRDYNCWDGYWTNSETSVWDCSLKTLMAPPTLFSIEEEEGLPADNQDGLAFFLFEKQYDALRYPEDGLTNELNGTCMVGQLILQGYEQEITNGRMLRDAYLYEEGTYEHDERMRLIDINYQLIENMEDMPWMKVKYRSDDDQRTIMSGQVLMRGMFDQELIGFVYESGRFPVIHTHTTDRSEDILTANWKACPKQELLYNAAIQSEEFQAFNNSEQSQKTRDFIMENLGKNTNDDDLLDCLMTTICTDRPLPDAVDDYGKVGSRFEQAAEFNIVSTNKPVLFNNSAYAKLAMAPLWTEIMDNIRPWLQPKPEDSATKLAIFSGHDTTLMPLLASLGPNLWNETDWPPYASMLLIEVHELIDGRADKDVFKSDFAFRLLFNGKILTNLIAGCPQESELCDISHFLDIVDPMTKEAQDCSVPPEEEPPSQVMVKTQALMSTRDGILLFLGVVAISFIIGAVGTFKFLTGRFPCTTNRGVESSVAAEERQGLQENGFEDEPMEEDEFIGGR